MYVVLLIIFAVNPLLGLICGAFYFYQKKELLSTDVLIMATLGAAFLGLINTTKSPDSDLTTYMVWYGAADDYGLFEYLLIFTREPLYYIWMYFISYVTLGSELAFIFISTFLPYFLILLNIARIGKFLSLCNQVIILILLCFIFFGPLFSLSAHLMRQFLAGALVFTFYTSWIVSGRRPWWLLILAALMHYSALIFLVFSVVQPLRRLGSLFSLFFAAFIFFVAFVFLKMVSGSLSSLPALGLIFSRIAAEEGADIGHLSLISIAFVIFLTIVSIAVIQSKIILNKKNLFNVCATVILIALIALVANMHGGTVEIAKRYYFYEYFLAALIFPLLVYISNSKKLISITALAFVVPQFFINLEIGVWGYMSLPTLFLLPSWLVWGG